MKTTILLLFLALCGLLHADTSYFNPDRGFAPFTESGDSVLIVSNETSDTLQKTIGTQIGCNDFKFSAYISNLHNNPNRKYKFADSTGKESSIKYPAWGIIAASADYSKGISIIIQTEISTDWDYADDDKLKVVISDLSGKILATRYLSAKDVSLLTAPNSVTLVRCENKITLKIGEKYEKEVWTDRVDDFNIADIGFIVCPGGCIDVKRASLSITPDNSQSLLSNIDIDNLSTYFSLSSDSLEGYWQYIDRSMDENLLRLGGDYTLALIQSVTNENEYLLIYLGGAKINHNRWLPGMIKARMVKTKFNGVYSVVWYDAQMLPLSHEITAQISDDFIRIDFPYQNSFIRLHRIANPY